jgi:hypothetical protein
VENHSRLVVPIDVSVPVLVVTYHYTLMCRTGVSYIRIALSFGTSITSKLCVQLYGNTKMCWFDLASL